MRERLTLAFVAIALLLLAVSGVVRSLAVQGELRDSEHEDVRTVADAIGVALGERLVRDDPVDRQLLQPFVSERTQVRYEAPGRRPIELTDADFVDDDPVSATVVAGNGRLTVSRTVDDSVGAVWGTGWLGTIALFAMLAFLAGLVGYGVARSISAPFRQLAAAASALGRGRFVLDLPRGGVPEAREIGRALESSADQLRARVEREREFSLHASHVLRTPLTSLRFRLESLAGDPDVPDHVRDTASAGLRTVGKLNQVAGELVEMGGRGVLVAGAAIPLRDLATQVAQRWADVLDGERDLTAAVEGDTELPFTPGPVEQVLDLLLEDVAAGPGRAVRLVFEGAASRLRVDVVWPSAGDDPLEASEVGERTRAAVDALGGHLEHPHDTDSLRLYLPRR
jgi:signal transduction histidine kinase